MSIDKISNIRYNNLTNKTTATQKVATNNKKRGIDYVYYKSRT